MNLLARTPRKASALARAFVACALIGLCMQSLAQGRMRMGSSSMAPTLAYGEELEINLSAYGASLPTRWEIVTFRHPDGKSFLNYRVVGLPGDTVSYDSKKLLHINGEAVTLSRTDLNIPTEFEEDRIFIESWHGEQHLILLRDGAPLLLYEAIEAFADRGNCSYSRQGFSCVVPPKKYFVMGDNRDSSNDSRYRGFIPIERIVGRVENTPILPGRR